MRIEIKDLPSGIEIKDIVIDLNLSNVPTQANVVVSVPSAPASAISVAPAVQEIQEIQETQETQEIDNIDIEHRDPKPVPDEMNQSF